MKKSTSEIDNLMSAQEVADYLGVPIKTIYEWRYMQKGPKAFRVGRFLRYRRSEVDEYLESTRNQ